MICSSRAKSRGITVRSSAADHRRPTRWDGLAAAVVAILAVALALVLYLPKQSGNAGTVTIQQGGSVVDTYDLSRLREPLTVTVDGPCPLTLLLSADGVQVTEHSCPDGDCARMVLKSGTPGQIVCLPNRTVITLATKATPSYDAVTK